LKGGKSRSKEQEKHRLLTKHEETALAKWISSSAISGNPVQHDFICEMAEKLWKQRIAPDGQFVPPVGPTWVPQVLCRHPDLKIKMT
jgi:Tc5 transposase DNA-binding domain